MLKPLLNFYRKQEQGNYIHLKNTSTAMLKAVQYCLQQAHCYPDELEPDGIWGPQTLKADKIFCKINCLEHTDDIDCRYASLLLDAAGAGVHLTHIYQDNGFSTVGSLDLPNGRKVRLSDYIIGNGHFTWSEFTGNGMNPPVTESVLDGMIRLAHFMERVRVKLDHNPIKVLQQFRSNSFDIGLEWNSRHCAPFADAIVFRPRHISLRDAYNRLNNSLCKEHALAMDYNGDYLYLDLRPYRARWRYSTHI